MNKVFKQYSRRILLFLFLSVSLLSLYVIKSFIVATITAALLSYIFYPQFKKLNRLVKSKGICSMIMLAAILLIVIIPVFFVINALLVEASGMYQNVKALNLAPLSNIVSRYIGEEIDLTVYYADIISRVVKFIVGSASDFAFSLPQKILVLFVIIFLMYYFFKEGDLLIDKLKHLVPLDHAYQADISKEFNKMLGATIYGVIVTAVIQGLIGTIGLIVFDVSSPMIWGAIMVIAAMIPLIGTWVIWLPASIFKIFNGELFNGIGLLLYGVLFVSVIDNIIKPKLISGKSEVHPALVLLGVIGGLKTFGFMGIILGPLILGMFYTLFVFYLNRIKK